ncbi:MAG: DUF21 domain-containing protein, partial [Acetatifactor sp.]|nr:DUF21 domain-containing protein [Acetatifactor sp.]
MEDAGPMAGIIFFVLLLMDIFFYGFDAAVSNLNEKELERRAEEKDVKSRQLLQIIADPDRYVNTLQLITRLIHVVAGSVYLTLWERILE